MAPFNQGEPVVYRYGEVTTLEPGEAKPDYAKHPGVVEAEVSMNLHDIVLKTNNVVANWCEVRNCCIFASGVLLDVLHARGYTNAQPVRIEAAARDDKGAWIIAGDRGDGSRQPAAAPGHWRGHMGVLVDGVLLDPTLDQISGQRPVSGPYAEDWWHAWYSVDESGKATRTWTTYPGEGVYAVRYVLIRDRQGWRGAPDWRRKRYRRHVTQLVLKELAA